MDEGRLAEIKRDLRELIVRVDEFNLMSYEAFAVQRAVIHLASKIVNKYE
jgi:hypothetical protein